MRRIPSDFHPPLCFTAQLSVVLLAASCTLVGCARTTTHAPATPSLSADAQTALTGQVIDEAGRPVVGADLHISTGVGTYFPLTVCRTDADGRFRVPIDRGAMIKEAEGRWAYLIGVRIENAGVPGTEGGLDFCMNLTQNSVKRLTIRIVRGTVSASVADEPPPRAR